VLVFSSRAGSLRSPDAQALLRATEKFMQETFSFP